MKTNYAALIAAVLVVSFSSAQLALAQYDQYDTQTKDTLQQKKDLAKEAVRIAAQNPHQGSGTPLFDPTGVIGSSIIIGAVFGGITIAFVIKSKKKDTVFGTR